jgi:regulatory protein YycI of two-component signal transduction system YycFG
MKPVHASPFEHQAKPMSKARNILVPVWEIGVTHSDKNGWFWSGNLKGWVQNRQLIPDNVFTEEFHPEETK